MIKRFQVFVLIALLSFPVGSVLASPAQICILSALTLNSTEQDSSYFITQINELIRSANMKINTKINTTLDTEDIGKKIDFIHSGDSSKKIWKVLSQIGDALTGQMTNKIRHGKTYKKFAGTRTWKKQYKDEFLELERKTRIAIKSELKDYFRQVLRTMKALKIRVVIVPEGIDSAGKGISIALYREVLAELADEDAEKYKIHTQTVKQGKPDRVYGVTGHTRRWTDELTDTDEASIVFFDRGPLHNRMVTEKAWKWTPKSDIDKFRNNWQGYLNEFKSKNYEVFSIWSNISLEHMIHNLNRRVTTEERQHLNSPVDARGIKMWNKYLHATRAALNFLSGSDINAFYVNSSYYFAQGLSSNVSRTAATSQGLMAGLNQILGLEATAYDLVIPISRVNRRKIFKNADFDDGDNRGGKTVRITHKNTLVQEKQVLRDLHKTQDQIRQLVELGIALDILDVDPRYALETNRALGVLEGVPR